MPYSPRSYFTYNGDGMRVKSVMHTNLGTTTTYFVGNHYEVTDPSTGSGQVVVTKYYFAGTQRIAMRKNGVLNYIIGDHLGSTSIVTDDAGNIINQTQYKAWGEVRYSSGTEQTRYQFTGQYSNVSDFGLMYYGSRWYDSSLSRFTSADSIVPAGVQGLDRFAYVSNNPVRYTDPSGHMQTNDDSGDGCKTRKQCGLNDNSGGGGSSGGSRDYNPDPSDGESGISSDNNNYNINDWLWDNVPSAIGYHGGVNGQIGAGIEPGITPFEFLLLFNWRSGEVSLFYSFEGFVYAGSPSLLGGNVYGGLTTVEGLSRNQFYEGPSLYGGITGAFDVFGKLGATFISGRSITSESAANGDIPPNLFIDPISQRPIEYHQASITFGGNLAGNGVDLGVLAGPAYTAELVSIQIPFWPIGR